MHAFAIDEYETPGSMHDMPIPQPRENEILVKIAAAGVNPVDWKIRDGGGPNAGSRSLPLVLGQDFSGTVEGAGDDVRDVRAGDRVFGMARQHGAYAQYTTVRNDGHGSAYAKTPDGVDDETAAALPTAGLTALASLDWLNVSKDDVLAIVGATGGVGQFAIQLGRERGVRVIAIAKKEKCDFAKRLGANQTIAYDRESPVETIKRDHPHGLDAVIDLASDGDTLKRYADVLKPGGRIVTTTHVADEAWFAERGFAAKNIALPESPEASPDGLEKLARAVADGSVKVALERRDPLAQAANVLAASKAGMLPGKAVLIP